MSLNAQSGLLLSKRLALQNIAAGIGSDHSHGFNLLDENIFALQSDWSKKYCGVCQAEGCCSRPAIGDPG